MVLADRGYDADWIGALVNQRGRVGQYSAEASMERSQFALALTYVTRVISSNGSSTRSTQLPMRDEPSRVPAVIIRIVPSPAVQRKSSATICGNACGIDAITVRGRYPRVPLAIVVDPCREQACVVCPGLGGCEATSQSRLRKGRRRANEKMTHNERSRVTRTFITLPPEGLKDCREHVVSGENFDAGESRRLRAFTHPSIAPSFLPCHPPVKITCGGRAPGPAVYVDELDDAAEPAK